MQMEGVRPRGGKSGHTGGKSGERRIGGVNGTIGRQAQEKNDKPNS